MEPKGYGRYFRRRNRPVSRGGTEPTTLDAVNDGLSERDLILHPTRGFRRLTPVRSIISNITANQKNGSHGWNTALIARKIKSARLLQYEP